MTVTTTRGDDLSVMASTYLTSDIPDGWREISTVEGRVPFISNGLVRQPNIRQIWSIYALAPFVVFRFFLRLYKEIF